MDQKPERALFWSAFNRLQSVHFMTCEIIESIESWNQLKVGKPVTGLTMFHDVSKSPITYP